VFKDHLSGRTKEDVFEQIINFTFSEKYPIVKGLIEPLLEKAVSFKVTEVRVNPFFMEKKHA
jgi:hypothetical protein